MKIFLGFFKKRPCTEPALIAIFLLYACSMSHIVQAQTRAGWEDITIENSPPARWGHSAIWTGKTMVILGGRGTLPLDASFRDGGEYVLGSRTWTPISMPEWIKGRFGQTTVWTGRMALVWGGTFLRMTNDRTFAVVMLDDGYLYTPGREEWRPIANTGAPSARHGHSAIWDNRGMIIWGGESAGDRRVSPGTEPGIETLLPGSGDNVTYLQDGARYFNDVWTPISEAGAPSARSGHTAVWTGRDMIVWGGRGQKGVLQSGGTYSPHDNAWRSLTERDAPSARSGHTAVWTGRYMIVWGGKDADGPLQDGGIYNPLNDSWRRLPRVGEPSARSGHSAIWTGEEMIIWGGKKGEEYLKTGGWYNLKEDYWGVVTERGVPPERSEHTALWNGETMIVWGGRTAGGPLRTGGVYIPTKKPVIVESPNEIGIRGENTIKNLRGQDFGAETGRVLIKLANRTLIANIVTWSDQDITFSLDPSLEGIPISAPGRLWVENAERRASDERAIIVQPAGDIHFFLTRERHYWGIAGINEDVPFYSPELPASYYLWSGYGRTESYFIRNYKPDDEIIVYTVQLPKAGLYDDLDGDRLQAIVHVEDEYIYNFSINYQFVISVPRGFAVPSGWQRREN